MIFYRMVTYVHDPRIIFKKFEQKTQLGFHSLSTLHVKSPKYDPILNINNSSFYHFYILT